MRIVLKYVKKNEHGIIPYYYDDGSLKGVRIKGARHGYMYLIKYFSEEAKQFLLTKFKRQGII